MTSLAGCSGESFASILRSLGYVMEHRPGPAITVPLMPAASREPAAVPMGGANRSGERASAADGAQSGTTSEMSAATDDSFLPLGIGDDVQETPKTTEENDSESAVVVSQEASAPEVLPASEMPTAEEPTAAPEGATLIALGDAPVTPEAVEASAGAGEGSHTESPSPRLQSLESSSAEPAPEAAADAGAEPRDETPAAPPMIEVWRMGRQQFQRRPERPQKRQPRVFNISPRPPKEGANGERRFRREPREEPRAEAAGENTAAAIEGGTERPARAPDNRPRFKGKGEGRRDERHDRRSARPTSFSTETRSRDRAPDPDSPFAKLAALKAELEKNKKG
jgi:ATP-dependent RNA helicase SUPV3L1/SUV3